jgi:hypothetical protein
MIVFLWTAEWVGKQRAFRNLWRHRKHQLSQGAHFAIVLMPSALTLLTEASASTKNLAPLMGLSQNVLLQLFAKRAVQTSSSTDQKKLNKMTALIIVFAHPLLVFLADGVWNAGNSMEPYVSFAEPTA